jgi:transcription initiation factor TFIIIB Brf1 subunit/transcription initiation factor TFIIB
MGCGQGKLCRSQQQKIYYKQNANHIKKMTKVYREQNADQVKERNKKWEQRNKARIAERKAAYYKQKAERVSEKNKVRRQIMKKNAIRYQIHKAYHAQYIRNRRKIDFNFKLLCVLRSRIYTALKSKNTIKNTRTIKLLGCSIEKFREHIENQFAPNMQWANHGEWHLVYFVLFFFV